LDEDREWDRCRQDDNDPTPDLRPRQFDPTTVRVPADGWRPAQIDELLIDEPYAVRIDLAIM